MTVFSWRRRDPWIPIWSTILIFIDRDENRSGKSCSGRCCIHIFPPVFCFLRKIRIQNGTRKTEPAHQEQLNKNGTGKSWRILLTVLIMKKTGLKTIEAFSWLFCQYPCSIFIQEFTPAFSFLLVASSFDTRQQYYCGGTKKNLHVW